MSSSNLSDIDIEILLFGKWRFDRSWEKITIFFKDDMTYEQTKIQTFLFSKPREVLTGNKFTGVWYVSDKTLYLKLKTMPKSLLNLDIPLLPKISIADAIATLGSVFASEKYKVIEIDSCNFLIKDEEHLMDGRKIKTYSVPNKYPL
ncbi:hypothetical protein I8752_25255 [Nostocaceae cyanobacterium CENA369]|uniref:Uncharacterized protein n=1 Tax=Dendronalium phyllosphericum CENA369 TaxID=1725256 RepID=A0A8J7I5D5_9NOST|nr:hypothetical protein [Dendronalium phyllosphericum]MBH8576240.1 hypothetical protein [Dendronalium phyllosphericum CENA369]